MSERPGLNDEPVLREAATSLAEECAAWDNAPAATWVECLVSARWHWSDGYEFAKYLDNSHGVSPDAELVDILDGASHHRYSAHDKAVKAWVAENGFKPEFSVGNSVQTLRHGVCRVNGVKHDKAQYVVTDGDERFANGGGYVLNAEDVTAVSQ